jgi:hypothetical protein
MQKNKSMKQKSEIFEIQKFVGGEKVIQLYAVAAKKVCIQKETYDEITQLLRARVEHLGPPDLYTVRDCNRYWWKLGRALRMVPEHVYPEVGRRFTASLDVLCQQIDVRPLPEWENISAEWDGEKEKIIQLGLPVCIPIVEAKEEAKRLMQQDAADEVLAASVGELLAKVARRECRGYLEDLVPTGALSRSGVSMVEQWIDGSNKLTRMPPTIRKTLMNIGNALAS